MYATKLVKLSKQQPAPASRLIAHSATLTRNVQTDVPEIRLQQPAATSDKVGVLLLNLGGPETLDDVEHFLFNLFNDPDIIRLPGQGTRVSMLQQCLQPSVAQAASLICL